MESPELFVDVSEASALEFLKHQWKRASVVRRPTAAELTDTKAPSDQSVLVHLSQTHSYLVRPESVAAPSPCACEHKREALPARDEDAQMEQVFPAHFQNR